MNIEITKQEIEYFKDNMASETKSYASTRDEVSDVDN